MKGEPIVEADIAASFQKAVCDVLVEHAMQAVKDYGINKLATGRRRGVKFSAACSHEGSV